MAPRAERPCVLSLVPGRVRLHLPGWQGSDAARIEDRLRRVPGVASVEANPRTGNALIRFDRRHKDEKSLLEEMYEAWASLVRSEEQREGGILALPSSLLTPHCSVVRVGVRGLLGHAVMDSLWFGAGFLGKAVGLPLAGLGPLHVLLDIAVWTMALRSGTTQSGEPPASVTRDQTS